MITERRRHVAESRVCEAPALGTHARLGRAHVDRPAVITVPVQRHKKRAGACAALDSLLFYYTISGHRAAMLLANTCRQGKKPTKSPAIWWRQHPDAIHLQGMAHLVDPGAHLYLAWEREHRADDDAQEHQRQKHAACIA